MCSRSILEEEHTYTISYNYWETHLICSRPLFVQFLPLGTKSLGARCVYLTICAVFCTECVKDVRHCMIACCTDCPDCHDMFMYFHRFLCIFIHELSWTSISTYFVYLRCSERSSLEAGLHHGERFWLSTRWDPLERYMKRRFKNTTWDGGVLNLLIYVNIISI